jgi:hypothetical protein
LAKRVAAFLTGGESHFSPLTKMKNRADRADEPLFLKLFLETKTWGDYENSHSSALSALSAVDLD